MISRYRKGSDKKLSAHFRQREFDCHCSRCKSTLIDYDLIELLEALRAKIQAPLIILSGYRCKPHNAEIGGAENSFHMRGMAADITASVSLVTLQAVSCQLNPEGGVGWYDTFVHVDTRGERWRGVYVSAASVGAALTQTIDK